MDDCGSKCPPHASNQTTPTSAHPRHACIWLFICCNSMTSTYPPPPPNCRRDCLASKLLFPVPEVASLGTSATTKSCPRMTAQIARSRDCASVQDRSVHPWPFLAERATCVSAGVLNYSTIARPLIISQPHGTTFTLAGEQRSRNGLP